MLRPRLWRNTTKQTHGEVMEVEKWVKFVGVGGGVEVSWVSAGGGRVCLQGPDAAPQT